MPGNIYSDYASNVSNILLSNANAQAEAARQRGQIWGQTLNALGEHIANLPLQYQQLKTQQQQQEMNAINLQMAKNNMAGMQRGSQLVAEYLQPDGTVNRAGLTQRLAADQVPLGVQTQISSQLDELEKSAQTHRQHTLDNQADLANHIIRIGQAGGDLASAVGGIGEYAKQTGMVTPQELQAFQTRLATMPQEQWGGELQAIRSKGSQYRDLYKPTVIERQGGVAGEPATGTVLFQAGQVDTRPKNEVELATDAATLGTPSETPTAKISRSALDSIQRQRNPPSLDEQYLEAKVKGDTATQQRILQTLKETADSRKDPNAQASVEMLRNLNVQLAQQRLDDLKGGKLLKVEHQDANGQTVIEWLPERDVKGQTFKAPVSGTVQNRLASSQAVQQTGQDLINKLQDPKYAANLGPVMGRYKTLQDFIGNPPPEFSELAGEIESYSLANMGVHGMRSAQGAEQIKGMLSAKHTPESLIGAIKGLNSFSENFMRNEGRGAALTPQTAPVPANVQAALKGAKAGRHTLSDGSVWTVGSDGSVSKAP